MLKSDELNWIGCRFLDPMGRIFVYENEIYRAIYPGKVEYVRGLFEKNIIESLVEKGLLIETKITDIEVDGYGLVLRHRKIPFITKPNEWNLEFLRDATICGIDLNLELLQYGLGTVDFHCFNVQQQGKCMPVWIDLGSICPLASLKNEASIFNQLKECFLNPLFLLSTKPELSRILRRLMNFGGVKDTELRNISTDTFTFTSTDRKSMLEEIRKWLLALKFSSLSSQWGEYQQNAYALQSDPDEMNDRSRVVYEIQRELKPKRVVDLSCNVGHFSFLSSRLGAETFSVDMDENAVGKLYNLAKTTEDRVSITTSIRDLSCEQTNKIEGEMTIALALSHHIAITQKFPFAHIAKVFSSYSKNTLLTEFMPNGLGGTRPIPNPPPQSYSLSEFRKSFEPYFETIETIYYPKRLDDSYRVLVLCKGKKKETENRPTINSISLANFHPQKQGLQITVICENCNEQFQIQKSGKSTCPHCQNGLNVGDFSSESLKPVRELENILNEKIDMPFILAKDKNYPLKSTEKTKKSINVLHLCTQDYGGAGVAAYRLHKGLQAIGVNSTMFVINKKTDDPTVKILPSMYSGRLLWERFNDLLKEFPNHSKTLELFTDAVSDTNFSETPEFQAADIINLHWVAGLLNFPTIPALTRKKHLVWTLHDMNPFTGGCHYAGSCEKYYQQCGACPQLGSDDNDDLSKRIWRQKQLAYKDTLINIVTPSRWLGECAGKSKLFSGFSIDVIPYGFPLDTFRPYPKSEARKELGVPENARVVLFGAHSVTNERKGFRFLLEALNSNKTQFQKKGVLLACFGTLSPGKKLSKDFPIHHFGKIDDQKMLATIYSAADVFILPTLEDNLPNTAIEALACGTPVVGFDPGGMTDIVEHRKTGFLVPVGEAKGLVEGIDWALFSNQQNSEMRDTCRKAAENKYALPKQAKNYLELYKKILGEENHFHEREKPMDTKKEKMDAETSFLPEPIKKNGISHQLEKVKEFWNVNSMDEAMFGKVFTDKRINNLSREERLAGWKASVVNSSKKILENIPHSPQWKVLEIGCGVGRIIKPLRKIFAQVDGVDIAEKMVQFAQSYLADGRQNGDVYLNSGSDLSRFEDKSYDYVFSMITFQHIRSISVVKSYFSEIFRVLKPGGYFRLQVADSSNAKMGSFNEEGVEGQQYGFHGNGYSPDQLKTLFEEHEFTKMEIEHKSSWIWATAQRGSALAAPVTDTPAFLENIIQKIDAKQYHSAIADYKQNRSVYADTPELIEFDRLMQKLENLPNLEVSH